MTLPLDWESARARLAAAEATLLAIDDPDEETLAKILHARALALATPKLEASQTDDVDLIVFRIDRVRYAIAAGDALESITIAEMTALPGVPAFYRGLISHRGIVYPLVDIRPLIGVPVASTASLAHAILYLSDAAALAIVADEVEAFVRVNAASITPAGSAGHQPIAAIRGVTPDAIVVLDIAVLAADARLVLDERSSRG